MAAFADPGIAGLLATIGGDDLLTVLPFLDPELVVANPKPFAATATTPTCSTGCGTSAWPAGTAARPWSTSAAAAA
jgi:hypothetical protein